MVRTQSQAQALLNLGGSEVSTVAEVAAATANGAYAYIVVPLWCPPSADGLSVPLPADTLAQQIMVTCQINPASGFWINNGLANTQPPPQALDVGFFQIEQYTMVDRGMAISNHVDLNTHELLMPITFMQQELQVAIPAGSNTAAGFSATLTGFRSGQVKAIQCWLTLNRSVAAGTGTLAQQQSDLANQLVWYAPTSVTVLYSGTIYANYTTGTSVLFNLLDGTKPPSVSTNLLSLSATPPPAATSVTSSYVMLPFGSTCGDDYQAEVLTHGKSYVACAA